MSRVLPHDLEAEQAVLAGCLLRPGSAVDILEGVAPGCSAARQGPFAVVISDDNMPVGNGADMPRTCSTPFRRRPRQRG